MAGTCFSICNAATDSEIFCLLLEDAFLIRLAAVSKITEVPGKAETKTIASARRESVVVMICCV